MVRLALTFPSWILMSYDDESFDKITNYFGITFYFAFLGGASQGWSCEVNMNKSQVSNLNQTKIHASKFTYTWHQQVFWSGWVASREMIYITSWFCSQLNIHDILSIRIPVFLNYSRNVLRISKVLAGIAVMTMMTKFAKDYFGQWCEVAYWLKLSYRPCWRTLMTWRRFCQVLKSAQMDEMFTTARLFRLKTKNTWYSHIFSDHSAHIFYKIWNGLPFRDIAGSH